MRALAGPDQQELAAQLDKDIADLEHQLGDDVAIGDRLKTTQKEEAEARLAVARNSAHITLALDNFHNATRKWAEAKKRLDDVTRQIANQASLTVDQSIPAPFLQVAHQLGTLANSGALQAHMSPEQLAGINGLLSACEAVTLQRPPPPPAAPPPPLLADPKVAAAQQIYNAFTGKAAPATMLGQAPPPMLQPSPQQLQAEQAAQAEQALAQQQARQAEQQARSQQALQAEQAYHQQQLAMAQQQAAEQQALQAQQAQLLQPAQAVQQQAVAQAQEQQELLAQQHHAQQQQLAQAHAAQQAQAEADQARANTASHLLMQQQAAAQAQQAAAAAATAPGMPTPAQAEQALATANAAIAWHQQQQAAEAARRLQEHAAHVDWTHAQESALPLTPIHSSPPTPDLARMLAASVQPGGPSPTQWHAMHSANSTVVDAGVEVLSSGSEHGTPIKAPRQGEQLDQSAVFQQQGFPEASAPAASH